MEIILLTGVAIVLTQLHFLIRKNAHFMSNTSQSLAELKATFTKAYGEVTTKIQALTDALANNQDNLSPESQAALTDLQDLAKKFDDIVPDAPTEEPPVETPPTV